METLTARTEKDDKYTFLLIEGNLTKEIVKLLAGTEIQSRLPYTFCSKGKDDNGREREGNIRYSIDRANPKEIISELNQFLKDKNYQVTLTSPSS